MNHRLTLVLLLIATASPRAEVVITPSEVYGQTLLIEQETQAIRRFINPPAQPQAWQPVQMNIRPRHVWQKAYMVQIKLDAFRRGQGLPGLAPVVLEPRLDLDPRFTWGQTRRILTEISFIRKDLGITGESPSLPKVEDKQPVDVYNKLAEIELQWDAINGNAVDSSLAFAQALRLNEDVDALMRTLNVFDSAIPPAKKVDAKPADSLAETFLVLNEVQRLQRMGSFETVDFSPFRKTGEITPNDVFNLICLTLAEVQLLKAQAGLTHAITPPATHQEGKTPAEVSQFLGYVTQKLRLIQHL